MHQVAKNQMFDQQGLRNGISLHYSFIQLTKFLIVVIKT